HLRTEKICGANSRTRKKRLQTPGNGASYRRKRQRLGGVPVGGFITLGVNGDDERRLTRIHGTVLGQRPHWRRLGCYARGRFPWRRRALANWQGRKSYPAPARAIVERGSRRGTAACHGTASPSWSRTPKCGCRSR